MNRSLFSTLRAALLGVSYAEHVGSLEGPTWVDLRAKVASPADHTAPVTGARVSHFRLELGARIDDSASLPPSLEPTQLFRFEVLAEETSATDLRLRANDAVLALRRGEFVVVAKHPEGGVLLPPDRLPGEIGRVFRARSELDLPAYRETVLVPEDVVTFSAIVRPALRRAHSAYRAGEGDETLTLEPGQPVVVVEKLAR